MREKTLLKEFFRYVSQNVLGMIGLSCYILADTFFIARGLGTKGLTALNLAIPVYSFVNGCGLMLGMGGATKYSIFRGKKEDKKGNQIFFHAVAFALVFAAVFMLTGIFLSDRLALVLGADREVFDMTRVYLRVILLFSPAFIFNDIFVCFVRNDGNPKLSMIAMLLGSFSNIILDYIFIFPLNLGILGAVLATGFAPVISMCILSKHLRSEDCHFHLEKATFSPGIAGKHPLPWGSLPDHGSCLRHSDPGLQHHYPYIAGECGRRRLRRGGKSLPGGDLCLHRHRPGYAAHFKPCLREGGKRKYPKYF